jgi:hypothetical protein
MTRIRVRSGTAGIHWGLQNIVTITTLCHFERSRIVRGAGNPVESRNLLGGGVPQQVPRLRSVIRFAADGTPLGMTRVWVVTVSCKPQEKARTRAKTTQSY